MRRSKVGLISEISRDQEGKEDKRRIYNGRVLQEK
jgi:hypothetical protein